MKGKYGKTNRILRIFRQQFSVMVFSVKFVVVEQKEWERKNKWWWLGDILFYCVEILF